MIVRVIFGSKLLSLFLMAVIYSFLTCDTDRQRQAAVTLTLCNPGLNRLGVTHFFILRHPYLGFDQARNQLGTPEGTKSFLGGAQNF